MGWRDPDLERGELLPGTRRNRPDLRAGEL